MAVVARAAAAAKRFPALPVTVRGYADISNTTPSGVQRLSKARTDAVAALLVADGVPTTSILRDAVGVPPNSNPGIESRRVEIDIGNP
ncbi:MAG: OmpA family protein [Acetobacteraceae bacterium]